MGSKNISQVISFSDLDLKPTRIHSKALNHYIKKNFSIHFFQVL